MKEKYEISKKTTIQESYDYINKLIEINKTELKRLEKFRLKLRSLMASKVKL